MKVFIPWLVLSSFFLSSSLMSQSAQEKLVPSNQEAIKAVKALYKNLFEISRDHILFGHQDALAYGVEWKEWYKRRSDVADIIGDFPAVVGWEISKLGQRPFSIDTVDFDHMHGWIKQVYKMGGINTISWHMDNFLGGDSWIVGDNVVKEILPGGSHHNVYKEKLDLFADFLNSLTVGFIFQKKIPIIFRPFHEHTGSWFWWGADHCTPAEYVALWQFTYHYLQEEKGINQLLWAYSPDLFRDENHYLERYPGDEYVDIIGMDDYHDVGANGNIKDLIARLEIVVKIADSKGKIPALTETGYEKIPEAKWWTEKLLKTILANEETQKIAWVLLWRNARPSHHYGPYPNHHSVDDFKKFASHEQILFASDLENIYKP